MALRILGEIMFQPDECCPRFKYSVCFNHLELCLLYLADFFVFFCRVSQNTKIMLKVDKPSWRDDKQ